MKPPTVGSTRNISCPSCDGEGTFEVIVAGKKEQKSCTECKGTGTLTATVVENR